MAYSKLGIINLALTRLGVKRIVTLTENSQQALDAVAVWEYILDEVLEAKEWKFSKTSIYLDKSDISPSNGYLYAYPLPNDLLKLVKKTAIDSPVSPIGFAQYDYLIETLQLPEGLEKMYNGEFTGGATGWILGIGWAYGTNNVSKSSGTVATLSQIYGTMGSAPIVDESYILSFEITAINGGSIIPQVGGTDGNPVSSVGVWNQIITAISAISGVVFTPSSIALTCTINNVSLFKISDRKCLFTDYYDVDTPIQITYIKRVGDPTKYSPSFINALAFRLAAELSINRTESQNKYSGMMQMYESAIIRADGVNQSFDYLEDESGSTEWVDAGR
jgi:hypothetical protein